MADSDDDKAWHLDKKVPITLIGAILVQTFGFGMWAENLNGRLADLERANPATIAEFAKLELAREAVNIEINTIQSDVKSLLSLARRNEDRNVQQDKFDNERDDKFAPPH